MEHDLVRRVEPESAQQAIVVLELGDRVRYDLRARGGENRVLPRMRREPPAERPELGTGDVDGLTADRKEVVLGAMVG